MNKYQPRFRPAVYLKFLNAYSTAITRCEITDPREDGYILSIFCSNGSVLKFLGSSAEDCLDEAINTFNFEKELHEHSTSD